MSPLQQAEARVFVEESRALPLVQVVLTLSAGSVFDPIGKEGLARTTARMLRRGAGAYSSDELEARVDELGAELGVDSSLGMIALSFEVIRRNLEPMLALACEVLSAPRFEASELERLKRELAAELVESRDSDRTLASRGLRRALFAGHPYARRVGGSLSSIATLSRDDVLAHHAAHFVREGAYVAVSGDVTEAEGRAIGERLLACLGPGPAPIDSVPEPTPPSGAHLVIVDKPSRTQTQIAVGSLGTCPHDPDHTAFLLANTVFGGTFTSRLMQEVRAKRGWSYGASSSVSFDRRRDTFSLWTAPKTSDAAPCLALELELLRAFADGGISEDDLAFVKKYLVRSHAFDIDTARKRVHQRLDEAAFALPRGWYESFVPRVEAVTLDEANRAARAWAKPNDLVTCVLGTEADVGAALRDVREWASVRVEPYDLE
jgi:zinc protease